MADTTLSPFSLVLPEVGSSLDSWGTKLNGNFTIIDGLFDGSGAQITPNLAEGRWKIGGTVVLPTAAELNFVDGVTSAIQTQLNAKQGLDADLTALAALATTGIMARTGAATYSMRTITGTGLAAVSNGAGAAGNPDINVPAASQAQAEAGSATTVAMTPQRTNQAIAALMATSQSLASSGHCNLASGLQLRWGVFSSTTDDDQSVTFSSAFSTGCYAVVTSLASSFDPAPTASGFTMNRLDATTGTLNCYYIAVGH